MSEGRSAAVDETAPVSYYSTTEKTAKKGHSTHPSVASSSASTLAGDGGRAWHGRSSRASAARTWASASEASRLAAVDEDTSPLILERFYLWETASVRPGGL